MSAVAVAYGLVNESSGVIANFCDLIDFEASSNLKLVPSDQLSRASGRSSVHSAPSKKNLNLPPGKSQQPTCNSLNQSHSLLLSILPTLCRLKTSGLIRLVRLNARL